MSTAGNTGTVHIFAYGNLKPGFSLAPRRIGGYTDDMIRGEMWNIPVEKSEPISEPAVIEVGNRECGWIHGYTMEIPHSELGHIWKEERDEYTRKTVLTYRGFRAIVYEWNLGVGKLRELSAERNEKGIWLPKLGRNK